MNWNLVSDRPIYAQLIEQIKLRIVSGMYAPGAKLPPVRDLAAEASVNPNTMQKALAELEREGLLYTQRTSGRYITEDEIMILEIKRNLAKEQIVAFFQVMQQLGYTKQETLSLMEEIERSGNK